jgi:hypothetical protein
MVRRLAAALAAAACLATGARAAQLESIAGCTLKPVQNLRLVAAGPTSLRVSERSGQTVAPLPSFLGHNRLRGPRARALCMCGPAAPMRRWPREGRAKHLHELLPARRTETHARARAPPLRRNRSTAAVAADARGRHNDDR